MYLALYYKSLWFHHLDAPTKILLALCHSCIIVLKYLIVVTGSGMQFFRDLVKRLSQEHILSWVDEQPSHCDEDSPTYS